MEDTIVANRHSISDGERKTRVSMSHAEILKIGFFTERDHFIIPSKNRIEPKG
jgi:hypothetical protein